MTTCRVAEMLSLRLALSLDERLTPLPHGLAVSRVITRRFPQDLRDAIGRYVDLCSSREIGIEPDNQFCGLRLQLSNEIASLHCQDYSVCSVICT